MAWPAPGAFAAVLVGTGDASLAEAVALAGGRVVATFAWGDSVVAPPGALILLDTTGVDPAILDAAMPGLADRADLVSCDLDRLDQVASALLFTDAQFLCAPTMADRVAALAVAAGLIDRDAAPAVRVGEAARLSRLSAEVARIAAALARLATEEGGGVADRHQRFDVGPAPSIDADDGAIDPQAIRAALRARRLRDGFFGDGLFEDPAWDMLLDLFAAELEGKRVSISSLCIAAAVAPTTALRWLNRLVAEGLLERRPDPRDKRRAFVALSARGSGAMRGYLAALARNGLTIS